MDKAAIDEAPSEHEDILTSNNKSEKTIDNSTSIFTSKNKNDAVKELQLPRVLEIKPKKPMQLHLLFWIENSKRLVETEKISHREAWHQSYKDWQNLKDKSQYQHLVEKEKGRYKREMEEFNRTGHFTNSDGINSKDIFEFH